MQTYKRRLSVDQLKPGGTNNIFDFLPDVKDYFFTESVRGGLGELIRLLWTENSSKVMLPVFVAEGVIRPFKDKNIPVIFYKLNADLSPDMIDIEEKLELNTDIRCMLVVHYFGFAQDLVPVKKICSTHSIILLEDCVHGLFSKDENKNYLGTSGDI